MRDPGIRRRLGRSYAACNLAGGTPRIQRLHRKDLADAANRGAQSVPVVQITDYQFHAPFGQRAC